MIHESSGRQVKSVRTAFRMIGVLQNYDGATVAQLERQLDIATSTVHNYLRTLQSMGYVVKRDGTYHLGLRLLTHGMAARSRLPLAGVVSDSLKDVSSAVSRPAWWVVEEHGRGLFVAKSAGDKAPEIYGRIGKRSFLHAHAPGKAMLATLSEDSVEEIVEYHGLPVQTNETVTDREELRRELERIREHGYAESKGQAALGVRSVGVALDVPAEYTSALGVFGHTHEFGTSLDVDVPAVLQQATADVEETVSEWGG